MHWVKKKKIKPKNNSSGVSLRLESLGSLVYVPLPHGVSILVQEQLRYFWIAQRDPYLHRKDCGCRVPAFSRSSLQQAILTTHHPKHFYSWLLIIFEQFQRYLDTRSC